MRTEPFQPRHLEQVVDLYRTINAGVAMRARDDVAAKLGAMLLEFPGNTADVGSVVQLDGSDVVGFLGVVPRRWRVGDGRRVLGATLTGMIVSERHRDGMTAARLLRTAVKQGHELLLSDRPTDVSVRLLRACGGFSPPAYGFGWRRDRGPWTKAVSRVADRLRWGRFGRAVRAGEGSLRRLGAGMDARMAARVKPIDGAALTVRALTAADVGAVLRALGPECVVVDDDGATWTWLLGYLDGYGSRGRMRAAAACGPDGSALGFWIYFARPDASAEMLAIVAPATERAAVLAALARGLDDDGLAIASGTTCVAAMPAVLAWGARVIDSQPAVVYTRDAEIALAFREGRAVITGLEGEAWV